MPGSVVQMITRKIIPMMTLRMLLENRERMKFRRLQRACWKSKLYRNKEGERILEFCAAINITVRKALFRKWVRHLVFYESGPSKTW